LLEDISFAKSEKLRISVTAAKKEKKMMIMMMFHDNHIKG